MNKQNIIRTSVLALALSAAGFVGITSREGYTSNTIIPTVGDVPTNGFGTTKGVKMGDVTDPVKALQRAYSDVQEYEGAVKSCVKVPLYQVEYDVYVDLAYNIGSAGFCGSTIVKRLNAEDYAGACEAVLMWRKAGGFDCSTPGNRRCAGLWTDRQRSHSKCMAAQ